MANDTIDGVDLRAAMHRYLGLPVFRDTHVARHPPELVVRPPRDYGRRPRLSSRRPRRCAGHTDLLARRITIFRRPSTTAADALDTLIHELSHLLAPGLAAGQTSHGKEWRAVYERAKAEARELYRVTPDECLEAMLRERGHWEGWLEWCAAGQPGLG
jgi:hypothetical protein